MVGIYFSGTGNTRHCVEKLVNLIDPSANIIPLESNHAVAEIEDNEMIVLGYPVQFSNAPYYVRDFIHKNRKLWGGKRILCVCTMGAFSGDGAGCTSRILKKYGAVILGGLHLKMPDSVCDSKLLKKSMEQNRQIIMEADRKIERAAEQIKGGIYPGDGVGMMPHLAGLFGQRLWFYRKTASYTDKLKISDACVGCGICVAVCPTQNISMKGGKATASNQCTMCYRCISQCPQEAITLLGESVFEQCRFEKYV